MPRTNTGLYDCEHKKMTELTIATPEQEDKAEWRRLYDAYADFYRVPMSDETAETVWGWLQDPNHSVSGLIARSRHSDAVGLAHFRDMPSPLRGTTIGFLDDLFVDPAVRGSGAAQALVLEVARIGKARGWSLFRWITREDNYRARALYDRVANQTNWVTYQYDL